MMHRKISISFCICSILRKLCKIKNFLNGLLSENLSFTIFNKNKNITA